MTFRFDPEHLRSETYRVPGNANENGLTAEKWTVLAELESYEAPLILDALADADVGGYTVPARGPYTKQGRHQLYVDAAQYNRAEETLMNALRGKTPRPYGARSTAYEPAPPHPIVAAAKRIWAIKPVQWTVCGVFCVVVFGGMLLLMYRYGEDRFPAVHEQQTVSPGTPGMGTPDRPRPWP